MLHICATYDYELFLGSSQYSEEEVLIEPTKRLLDVFDSNGVKLTLFADTCCLLRYRNQQIEGFPNSAENQMLEAVKRGHDVQLHIHPHWMKAQYEHGNWIYDYADYRIHSFGKDGIEKIIAQNVKYLNELLVKADSFYKCIAFRAGGYCLQPERDLIRALYKNGIRIDSSVCCGNSNKILPHLFDYTNIPKKHNWDFAIEKGLDFVVIEDDCPKMMEIPIFGISNVAEKLFFKATCGIVEVEPLKGEFVANKSTKQDNGFINKLHNYFKTSYILQFDRYDYQTMMKMVKRIADKKNIKKNEIYIAIIGHPKLQGDALLSNTDMFIKMIKKEYGDLARFDTMQKIAKVRGL